MRKTCLRLAEWALIALGAAFVIAFGDAIWRHSVRFLPGSGYAFCAAAGFLLLTAWPLTGSAYRRARGARPLSVQAAGLWGVAAVAAAAATLNTAAVLSLIPGRNGQLLGSLAQDEPMWVEAHPAVLWAFLPGLAAGAVFLVARRGTGRRRRPENTR